MVRPVPSASASPAGAQVPTALPSHRAPLLLTPAAARALRRRMLLLRHSATSRIEALTGVDGAAIREFHRELSESGLPETLLQRGAHGSFAREFPQGGLLYLTVRALRPARIVETGIRPGYSTAWMLAALAANGSGELVSLGPGSGAGRTKGVGESVVGQFVPPTLRARWTLVLGN